MNKLNILYEDNHIIGETPVELELDQVEVVEP